MRYVGAVFCEYGLDFEPIFWKLDDPKRCRVGVMKVRSESQPDPGLFSRQKLEIARKECTAKECCAEK